MRKLVRQNVSDFFLIYLFLDISPEIKKFIQIALSSIAMVDFLYSTTSLGNCVIHLTPTLVFLFNKSYKKFPVYIENSVIFFINWFDRMSRILRESISSIFLFNKSCKWFPIHIENPSYFGYQLFLQKCLSTAFYIFLFLVLGLHT